MIVRLSGTLLELNANSAVLEVAGIGYELGISAFTRASLPAVGDSGVSLFVRMLVRQESLELYGFYTKSERALFDRLVAISGVGPKLALAVLSTYSLEDLAAIVSAQDATKMSLVPGVGKRKASRLLVELEGVFAKDQELMQLVGIESASNSVISELKTTATTLVAEVTEALLSMGFTSKEAELALKSYTPTEQDTLESVLALALRHLGKGA